MLGLRESSAYPDADKVLSVLLGLPGYERDPDVIATQKSPSGISLVLGDAPEFVNIAAQLQNKLFIDVVRQRLGRNVGHNR